MGCWVAALKRGNMLCTLTLILNLTPTLTLIYGAIQQRARGFGVPMPVLQSAPIVSLEVDIHGLVTLVRVRVSVRVRVRVRV